MVPYPLHPHPLTPADPSVIYRNQDGKWKCDNCENTYYVHEIPRHCSLCNISICEHCFTPRQHKRHAHQLFYCPMGKLYPQYEGRWKCDACGCTKGPPEEPFAYHCFQDDFDLCMPCFKGRVLRIHRHPLIPADSIIIYGRSRGLWICNSCQRTGESMNNPYSWHCPECEFDCCNDCLKEILIPQHPHPLMITDSQVVYAEYQGQWKCDICRRDTNPTMRNYDKPYHCHECADSFDACHECVSQIVTSRNPQQPGVNSDGGMDIAGPSREHYQSVNMAAGRDVAGPSSHMYGMTRDSNAYPPASAINSLRDDEQDEAEDSIPESEKCIVCYMRRKTATIVHGNTGHVCCCIRCALILKEGGKPCPICRAPIDRVIKQFVT